MDDVNALKWQNTKFSIKPEDYLNSRRRKDLTTKARIRSRTLSDDIQTPGWTTVRSPQMVKKPPIKIPTSAPAAGRAERSFSLSSCDSSQYDKIFSPIESNRKSNVRKNNYKDKLMMEAQQRACVYTSSELFRITCSLNTAFPRTRDAQGSFPIHNAVACREPNLMVVTELLKL